METNPTNDTVEVELQAPFLFDETIGHWTGEPDREALSRALSAAPQHPEVEYLLLDAGVHLRGPAGPVYETAAALRELGLT